MELNHPVTRYAVVTGGNRGIGFETVRQLAEAGATVVLTARNEKRGVEAVNLLHESGLSNVLFHQLDVQDARSIQSLAQYIQKRFQRLDILVNNAGASGVEVDGDRLRAKNIDPATWVSLENVQLSNLHVDKPIIRILGFSVLSLAMQLAGKAVNMIQDVMKTTYETAKQCIETNYYGVKNLTEALLPLLERSTLGARIVNVSSLRGELWRVPDEHRRKELGDIDTLTEEKIDKILDQFLHDVQHDAIEGNGWQMMLPAYSISKVSLNAYTRLTANKYPNMCINCVHPGYVNTDLNWRTGPMPVEEGAQGSVMLALLPEGGATGCYFDRTNVAHF